MGELLGPARGVCSGGPLGEDGVVGAARDQVEVDVFDELSGAGVVVVEEIVAWGADGGGDGGGQPLDEAYEFASQFGGQVFESLMVGLGDDEGVAFAEGANVEEGQGGVVFEELVTGDSALNDFAEDAVVGHDG